MCPGGNLFHVSVATLGYYILYFIGGGVQIKEHTVQTTVNLIWYKYKAVHSYKAKLLCSLALQTTARKNTLNFHETSVMGLTCVHKLVQL